MEDNIITEPIRKYFKTLEYNGVTSAFEYKALLMLLFLYQYINYSISTEKNVNISEIYRFYNCLYKQSCFIDNRLANICIKEYSNRFTYTFNFELA